MILKRPSRFTILAIYFRKPSSESLSDPPVWYRTAQFQFYPIHENLTVKLHIFLFNFPSLVSGYCPSLLIGWQDTRGDWINFLVWITTMRVTRSGALQFTDLNFRWNFCKFCKCEGWQNYKLTSRSREGEKRLWLVDYSSRDRLSKRVGWLNGS